MTQRKAMGPDVAVSEPMAQNPGPHHHNAPHAVAAGVGGRVVILCTVILCAVILCTVAGSVVVTVKRKFVVHGSINSSRFARGHDVVFAVYIIYSINQS